MGNLLGYCYTSESILEKEETVENKPVYSWDTRKDVDPADYCFDDLVGETRGKAPGSVDGMQFSIENCKDCILFVLDHVASVTIDDCTNCVIFIGPSKGSVFIRDCTDVKLAVCCQQFRTRDCKRVDTYLHCNTQPIIESSTDMRFACLQVSYSGLADQVKGAGISLYNNEWSNIYDFTPVDHGPNFSLLCSSARFDTYLTREHVSPEWEMTCSDSVFPLTVGNRVGEHIGKSALLSLFLGKNGTNEEVDGVIKHLQSKECRLRKSKEVKMNTDTIIRIYTSAKNRDNLVKFAKEGIVIGFEVEGDVDLLRATLPTPQNILLYLSDDETSAKEINSFFNYVDMCLST